MFFEDLINILAKRGRNASFSRGRYVCFDKFNAFSSSKTSINNEGSAMSRNVRPKNRFKIRRDAGKSIAVYLVIFPLISFVIRLITSINIQAGGWAGADGENYLSGVDAFLNYGFFAGDSVLTYWPAGYPLLIWPFAAISLTKFVYMLVFVQSLFFAFSTYYLTKSISKTKLSYLAFTASLLISFNPTLSLGSLAIGYETPVASCLMMALAVAVNALASSTDNKFSNKSVVFIGFWFSLASFMQPRFILVAIVFILLCAFYSSGRINRIKTCSIGLIVMLLLPSLLVFRNVEAVGKATISTNLGVTMSLGAGDETLGGYKRIGPAIDCKSTKPDVTASENEIVKCILEWYASNPVKTAKLAFHKSLYFWSPWSGPVAEGTMARNPWLKISPIQSIQKSVEGAKLIRGDTGKLVSYLWLMGQIALLLLGFFSLYKRGGVGKQVALLAATPVLLAWLITLGTIGDHRFRIPTMGLSLLLQVAGILAIREKTTKVL